MSPARRLDLARGRPQRSPDHRAGRRADRGHQDGASLACNLCPPGATASIEGPTGVGIEGDVVAVSTSQDGPRRRSPSLCPTPPGRSRSACEAGDRGGQQHRCRPHRSPGGGAHIGGRRCRGDRPGSRWPAGPRAGTPRPAGGWLRGDRHPRRPARTVDGRLGGRGGGAGARG